MATVSVWKEVELDVEVDLNDFDDAELIQEMEARGYVVEKEPEIITIEEYWNQGNKKEALILLEREYPELRGISNILN